MSLIDCCSFSSLFGLSFPSIMSCFHASIRSGWPSSLLRWIKLWRVFQSIHLSLLSHSRPGTRQSTDWSRQHSAATRARQPQLPRDLQVPSWSDSENNHRWFAPRAMGKATLLSALTLPLTVSQPGRKKIKKKPSKNHFTHRQPHSPSSQPKYKASSPRNPSESNRHAQPQSRLSSSSCAPSPAGSCSSPRSDPPRGLSPPA
jgi:hypothetical protein